MALPFTLHTKLSISTTSVRLFHVPIISPRASHKPFEVNASTLRLRGLSLSLVSDKRLCHWCSSSRTRVSMATKGEVKKEVFESAEDLAVSLAKYTAQLSDKFCKERGAFSVVLSGGSLINSLRKLVEPPYIDSIEWSKWHIFWADERVVPKDHEDSNYKLAYDGFLSKLIMWLLNAM
ncbi:hypothetical protein SO802_005474 [Lithocarpus litseifolius]|uniref:Glucosamine/galactosamine-6-phosphate isomerase domain-containing protein n=1 Tax=Lithocarpus litseifolius TaxID=425828 RepID=A0AAW2DMV0_9ROSI